MMTITERWQVYTVSREWKGRASIPEAAMITVPEPYSLGGTTLPWTVTPGQNHNAGKQFVLHTSEHPALEETRDNWGEANTADRDVFSSAQRVPSTI